VAQAPAEWITINFITGLPPAEYYRDVYNAVLVMVNRFTKFAWYIACKKMTSAEVFLGRVAYSPLKVVINKG
jgi:hypothetical protein